ncbi:MAG: hypothetical protein JNM72_03125 [Deltaproteobacteria bacterium]|jgi:hypothetical protein|nr:hypothetical protein [Deltaproteobacteria bacterium]
MRVAARLLLRAAGPGWGTLVSTGLISVLPQAHAAGLPQAWRGLWLASALLLGTLASLGVMLRPAARLGPLATGAAAVGMSALLPLIAFFVSADGALAAALMLLALTAARALAQLLTRELDPRGVFAAGPALREANDRAGLLWRQLGMLLGPPAAAALGLQVGRAAGLALLGGALTLGGVWSLAAAGAFAAHEEQGSGPTAPPTRAEVALIWAGRLLYGGLSLCSALLFGVLSELHGVADAKARVATILPLPPLAAVLATLAWARLGRGRALGPAALLPAAGGLVVFGIALLTPLAARLPLAALGAGLLGVAFAAFLAAFRGAASAAALAERPALLHAYNNLSNTGALLGFGLLLPATALAPVLGAPAPAVGAALISGLGLAAGGVVAALLRARAAV